MKATLKILIYGKNIDKKVIKDFIEKFGIYGERKDDIFGIKSRMPIEFIRKYIDENR